MKIIYFCFQFYMIAAHLNPTDSEEWAKLAMMSLDFGKLNEAIVCYDKGMICYSKIVLTRIIF